MFVELTTSAILLLALGVVLEFAIVSLDGVRVVAVAVFIPDGIGCSFGFDWKEKNKNMELVKSLCWPSQTVFGPIPPIDSDSQFCYKS